MIIYKNISYSINCSSAFSLRVSLLYIQITLSTIFLLSYLLISIGIFFYRNCIRNKSEIFINILLGVTVGTIIPVFFYLGNSSKYLFFNEMSSNKEVCSMPSKQTFKCNVYKNGQLVGSA